jgi:hypothetical protein
MRRNILALLIGGASLVSGIGVVAAAPSRPDVQAQLQGPSTSAVSVATTYTVVVTNVGSATAQNVQLVVNFPLTNTSPTVRILGDVTESDSRCSIAANRITCALDSIKRNKSVTVAYTYAAPVSTKTLTMTATTSTSGDVNAGNNVSSFTPTLTYPIRPITSATVNNSHCTGTNLTSYVECLPYPSSIASHVTTLNADTSITFSEPGYTGSWSQNAAKTSLFFEYFENAVKVAEFNGFAINGANCFDGLTTFFPASSYVSPYRVCIQ